MLNIKKQISRLYLSTVLDNLSLTGAWVAILAARGYSLVEIGFAETVFHITSLLFEIPSGVLADVFGRKNMLILGRIMNMIADCIIIFSCNLFMICLSMVFRATSYNFASGSGDALAYDSLKRVNNETYYEKYASNQMIIYRLCSGFSTLCAGAALLIGYKPAYATGVLTGIVQIWILTSLYEVPVSLPDKDKQKRTMISLRKELLTCFTTSLSFLKKAKKAVFFMFCNSLIGAVDTLLLFFLQAKLPEAGIPGAALGVALFFMELGGILGSRIILKGKTLRYRSVFVIATLLVFGGVLVEHSKIPVIMAVGGFIAAASDDAIQIRTNTILQEMFPSSQRATLISMESFTFSMIMIALSPLAGIFFSRW